MPLELTEQPELKAPGASRTTFLSKLSAGRTIRSQDRMFFTEQLALLLETGMALVPALEALANQASNPAMRTVIEKLKIHISEGGTLAQGLAQHPEVFNTTYINLVAASEAGGFLHEVLAQLLASDEKREELRSTVVSALAYPAFLAGFSILVVIFVLVVVFPKFADMFTRIADQLPGTTLFLMQASDLLRLHWMETIAVVAGVGFGLHRWLSSKTGAAWADRVKLTLPVLKDIMVQLYLVQTLRVMSLSLGRGVSIVDTLDSCRDVVANGLFRGFLKGIESSVKEGGTVAAGFENVPFIPDLVKQMVTTAETSGNLAVVMGRVADFYERELGKKLTALSKMAEPVMLLIMGLVVGIIVSSLILPIFKLSRAVT